MQGILSQSCETPFASGKQYGECCSWSGIVFIMMKVLELFSGIGGMHFALKDSGVDFEVSCALDINTTANTVYRHNFPTTRLMENNVECLDEDMIEKMGVQMITMSPPCQPFTRVGLQKDEKDNRTSALQHILNLIPRLRTIDCLLLENVVGFETSNTREQVTTVLKNSGFKFQEFILSPVQFFIPNSRARYYLLAKRGEFVFNCSENILKELPQLSCITNMAEKFKQSDSGCYKIGHILDNGQLVPDNILKKYSLIMDIVTRESKRSCCFTKGYTHYTEGTGSIFCPKNLNEIDEVFQKIKEIDKNSEDYLKCLKSLNLRYFSPDEVSRLMAFPSNFSFPSVLSNKQKYRLLGNSINVHVVAVLIKLLVL